MELNNIIHRTDDLILVKGHNCYIVYMNCNQYDKLFHTIQLGIIKKGDITGVYKFHLHKFGTLGNIPLGIKEIHAIYSFMCALP